MVAAEPQVQPAVRWAAVVLRAPRVQWAAEQLVAPEQMPAAWRAEPLVVVALKVVDPQAAALLAVAEHKAAVPRAVVLQAGPVPRAAELPVVLAGSRRLGAELPVARTDRRVAVQAAAVPAR